MSGHSKWAQIKYKKAVTDAKKSQVFSKLASLITVAAREKGGDPGTNPKLRLVVEKARSMNMPLENINRAIGRGTGDIPGATIEEAVWEAYGPGGVALMIEGLTDNKNRTTAELRHLLESYGGKLVESGSVKWLFREIGRIAIHENDWKEELAITLIDLGAEDIRKEGDVWSVYAPLDRMENLKAACEKTGAKVMEARREFIANTVIEIQDRAIRDNLVGLFDALDEHPDVKEIYSNALLPS